MVDVTSDHPLVTDQVRGGELRVLSQGLPVLVAHAVGFDVPFIDDIEAEAVAQREPPRVIRVMAGAHRIDIQFLHDTDIPDHVGDGDHIALVRVQFVAVGALDQDRLAVDLELDVFDRDGPETERNGRALGEPVAVKGADFQRIEVRGLGRPEGRGIDMARRADDPVPRLRLFAAGRGLRRPDGLPERVADLEFQFPDALADLGHDRQVAVHGPVHMDILQAVHLPGIDLHAAGDAAQAPEILILQVGPVAPAEDLQGQEVLPRMDILRNVETGLQLAVLAVADLLPVDPDADVRGRGADVQADLPSDPAAVHGESATVLAGIIVLRGRDRRIVLVMAAPGIADVDIQRIAKAVEFPVAGNGNRAPLAVVIVRRLETAEAAVDGLVEMELPRTVQAQRLLLVRHEGCAHRHPVDFEDIRILPVGKRVLACLRLSGGEDRPEKEDGKDRDSGFHVVKQVYQCV